jgi:hypothetical protein
MKTRLPPADADSWAEREEAKAEWNFGQIWFLRIIWAAVEPN